MTGTIWLCLAEGDEHGPRIRAWTTDPKRAGQLRADGLDMVEYRCLAASAPGEQRPAAYVSRLDLAKVRASGCVNTILTRDPQRPAEGIVPVYTSAPPAPGCPDWGQIVQSLLRSMDHSFKGENSSEQAERMADDLCKKYPAPRREAPASSGVTEPLADISTGQLFNTLLSRINFDGMDPRTFSLAELKNAIDGAEWPR